MGMEVGRSLWGGACERAMRWGVLRRAYSLQGTRNGVQNDKICSQVLGWDSTR